jgi:hypothetical protein
MLLLPIISLFFGENFAEIDYSMQVGAAPKPAAAIVQRQLGLPSAQASTDASNLRIPMTTLHRDVMGSGYRQPQLFRLMAGPWPERGLAHAIRRMDVISATHVRH